MKVPFSPLNVHMYIANEIHSTNAAKDTLALERKCVVNEKEPLSISRAVQFALHTAAHWRAAA